MPRAKTLLIPLIAIAALLGILAGWARLGYPTSLDEARLLRKLASSAANKSPSVRLAEFMPGEWERVCWSHPYDGPLYLERYGKTYPPVAPADDGTWGLIFIAKDGSYRAAVGSCGRIGVELSLEPKVCIERAQATLRLTGHDGACAIYSFRNDRAPAMDTVLPLMR